jgi:hypothetical protein
MANELVQVIGENEARVNVTYAGQNNELPQPEHCRACGAVADRTEGHPSMNNVFHIVIWAETKTSIHFQLGLEGSIARREDAERLVEAYRERAASRKPIGDYPSRIGILEIPAPDPVLQHPSPLTSEQVESFIAEMKNRHRPDVLPEP